MTDQTTPTDISPELITLARQIARDCRTPGTYAINITISPHKSRISAATITKLEQIREISPLTTRPAPRPRP